MYICGERLRLGSVPVNARILVPVVVKSNETVSCCN